MIMPNGESCYQAKTLYFFLVRVFIWLCLSIYLSYYTLHFFFTFTFSSFYYVISKLNVCSSNLWNENSIIQLIVPFDILCASLIHLLVIQHVESISATRVCLTTFLFSVTTTRYNLFSFNHFISFKW